MIIEGYDLSEMQINPEQFSVEHVMINNNVQCVDTFIDDKFKQVSPMSDKIDEILTNFSIDDTVEEALESDLTFIE